MGSGEQDFPCLPFATPHSPFAPDHAAPSRIGGWNDNAVSQGKNIQVSCDTSVMKVSTSGRPIGLAYTVAKWASGIRSRTNRAVLPVSTRSSTISSPLPVPPPSLAVSGEMPFRLFRFALLGVIVTGDADGID